MALIVVDVSSVLHTGQNIPSTSKIYNGINLSGMNYLVSKIARHLNENDRVVLCFDRKHSKKFGSKYPYKSELEGYQSNRKTDMSIVLQNEMALDFFTRAGVPCLRHQSMTADDLVYNVVEWNRKYGPSGEIKVLTADYDLAHNVGYYEGKSIELLPANTNVNKITYMNFRYAIYPGEDLLLNTISAYKVFKGDASDNIKAMAKGDLYYKQYKDFLGKVDEKVGGLSSFELRERKYLDMFLNFVAKRDNWNDELVKTYQSRANVIYPKDIKDVPNFEIDEDIFKGALMSMINKQEFVDLMYLSGSKVKPAYLRKELRNGFTTTSRDLWNEYLEEYQSGRFQATLTAPARTPKFESISFTGREVIE